MYHKVIPIENEDYLIEISRTKTKVFIIAFRVADPKSSDYSLEFTEKQMFKLLSMA